MGNTNLIQRHHNFLLSTESDVMKSQPSDFQRNPACSHFGPTDSSPAALVSGNYSEIQPTTLMHNQVLPKNQLMKLFHQIQIGPLREHTM